MDSKPPLHLCLDLKHSHSASISEETPRVQGLWSCSRQKGEQGRVCAFMGSRLEGEGVKSVVDRGTFLPSQGQDEHPGATAWCVLALLQAHALSPSWE